MAKNTKKQPKINRHPQTKTNEFEDESLEETTSNKEEKQKVEYGEDCLPDETPEDVKDFLTGGTDELPENSEIISGEEVNELWEDAGNIKYEEQHQKELDSAFENIDKDLDEDSYTNDNGSDEVIKEKKSDCEQSATDEVSSEDTFIANNQVAKPVGEVVANTKEEQRLLKEKNAKIQEIQELEEKNTVLEREAEKFDNLASTMDSEPFIELKSLVKEAIKTYVDRDDFKEMKKKTKNFEAICQMQDLLTEYRDLATENRQNITANNNEIENLKNRIEDIDSKLHNFQTKLDIETENIP